MFFVLARQQSSAIPSRAWAGRATDQRACCQLQASGWLGVGRVGKTTNSPRQARLPRSAPCCAAQRRTWGRLSRERPSSKPRHRHRLAFWYKCLVWMVPSFQLSPSCYGLLEPGQRRCSPLHFFSLGGGRSRPPLGRFQGCLRAFFEGRPRPPCRREARPGFLGDNCDE